MQIFASLKATIATLLLVSIASTAHAGSSKSDKTCPKHTFKGKPKVGPLTNIARISQLPPNLVCLNLNNLPSDLTGYTWYPNVSFDSRIAVNPKNPKNMIIAAQQAVLTDAGISDTDLPIAIIALYTLDGGITWNESDLVLSRCVNATLYEANDNFISAYFPSVSFDSDGNGYVLSSSFNLFAADQQPTVNTDEGNIVAKTTDGGASWNLVTKAERDDGTCHFLDYTSLTADPFRQDTVYIVSADTTCDVRETCDDPNFTGNNNITFQKSTDGGAFWTGPSLIASFVSNPSTCTPTPFLNEIVVLPDSTKTLLVSSYIQESEPDVVYGVNPDRLLAWSSKDGGNTWNMYTIADNIQHVLPFDPDTSSPRLPFTEFSGKDMAVNQCTGDIYVVYADPQFNPNGQAGCVIRRSKNGGRTWSKPQPVNPNSVGSQTFLPAVAVAKDGTVGVLFYDFRNYKPGDEILSTDVWISLFSENLKQHKGEVRLTPNSFDSRKAMRGYNGLDLSNCEFDYYLSNLVGLKANGNDFVASFTVTNDACEPVQVATSNCDGAPFITEDCNRQNIAFVRVNRTKQ